MNKKSLHKSLFVLAITLSLASFIYVNAHASLSGVTCAKPELAQKPSVKEEQENETREIPVPDVAVLARLVQLVQKFTPGAH